MFLIQCELNHFGHALLIKFNKSCELKIKIKHFEGWMCQISYVNLQTKNLLLVNQNIHDGKKYFINGF